MVCHQRVKRVDAAAKFQQGLYPLVFCMSPRSLSSAILRPVCNSLIPLFVCIGMFPVEEPFFAALPVGEVVGKLLDIHVEIFYKNKATFPCAGNVAYNILIKYSSALFAFPPLVLTRSGSRV